MPGPKPKHDYKALWLEYSALRTQSDITLTQYCEERELNMTRVSTFFADYKREAELNIIKSKNPEIMVLAQGNIERALANQDLKPEFVAEYSLKAFTAIADREGMSPQASVINIQNTANAQANNIVPIFASPTDDFKKLLGGE